MNLDLSKIISGVQNQLNFNFDFVLDKSYMESIGSVEASAFKVFGTVKRLEKRYDLNLTYSGEIVFECHRCLKSVSLHFEDSMQRLLVTKVETEEDQEWLTLESSVLDLRPILEEEITLNLPLQVLCANNCNGLCPGCGVDLNIETCTCEETKIDPRLEALKHFTHLD